jgi:hypothetical protein
MYSVFFWQAGGISPCASDSSPNSSPERPSKIRLPSVHQHNEAPGEGAKATMPPPGPSAAGLSKDAKDAKLLRHEAVISIAEMFTGGVAGILRDAARMACESDAMQDG